MLKYSWMILSLLLSQSSCNKEEESEETLAVINAENVDELATTDEDGNVTSLQGFQESENIEELPESSEANIFVYEEPSNMDADFSKPIMTTATYLALQNSYKESCEGLEYQDEIPTVKDVLSEFKLNNSCGLVTFNFCIRLKFISESENPYLYLKSPFLSLTVDCEISAEVVPNIEEPSIEEPSAEESPAPATPTIVINDSAEITTSANVNLTLSAPTATRMYITNTAACASGGNWEDYNTSKNPWTLGETNTETTVYAKFEYPNAEISSCVQASITHNSIGPTLGELFTNISTTTYAATFTWSAAEDTDGIASYELAIATSTTQDDSALTWTSIADTTKRGKVLTGLALTSGTTYYGRLRAYDSLGNVSSSTKSEEFIANSRDSFTAGRVHSCIIMTSSNHLKCWGINIAGQLGQGNTDYLGDNGSEMGSSLPIVQLGGQKVVQVNAGRNHTCALLENNDLKCWGENDEGELGLGDNETRGDEAGEMGDDLEVVDTGDGGDVIHVSIFLSITCVLLDSGKVKCWGNGEEGQGGVGNTEDWGLEESHMGAGLIAVNLGEGRTVTRLSTAGGSVCATLDNNTVKCWGSNDYGNLGQGSISNLGNDPANLNDIANHSPLNFGDDDSGNPLVLKDLSSNGTNFCALFTNSKVKCWGKNHYGQLGYENNNNIGDDDNEMGNNLAFVDLGTGRTAKRIYNAQFNSCAQLDNDEFKCWGRGYPGILGSASNNNLGDGSSEMGDSLSAIDIGSSTLLQLSPGGEHMCALTTDNEIKCWGNNSNGQLGLGDSGYNVGDNGSEMGDNLAITEVE